MAEARWRHLGLRSTTLAASVALGLGIGPAARAGEDMAAPAGDGQDRTDPPGLFAVPDLGPMALVAFAAGGEEGETRGRGAISSWRDGLGGEEPSRPKTTPGTTAKPSTAEKEEPAETVTPREDVVPLEDDDEWEPAPSTRPSAAEASRPTASRAPRRPCPLGSFGLRFGLQQFEDDLVDFVYGDMFMGGFDFRQHFGEKLWLAARVAFDIGYDSRGLPDGGDTSLFLMSTRISGLIAPPPGMIGNSDGSFYLYPYAGGGVDLVWVTLSVDSGALSGFADDYGIGFHAVGGVDAVFSRVVSVGFEIQYAFAEVDDVEFGGLGYLGTLRFHF